MTVELAWLPSDRDGGPEHQAELDPGLLACSCGWWGERSAGPGPGHSDGAVLG